MATHHPQAVIIGGGLAGLACARRLHDENVGFTLLEAAERVGGRVKTDVKDGFLLDRGFQVLQTAYPEARRVLDYRRLDLRTFAPGAMIRIGGRFHTVADPLRRPLHLPSTLRAPIGTVADRLRLLNLARKVTRSELEPLFAGPETSAMAFLAAEGFSRTMIERFFVPFFGGVCLDPQIRASSRVLQYVLRMFAAGDAAVPAAGMEQLPLQLAESLPADAIRTGIRVEAVEGGVVALYDGTELKPEAVILAVDDPEVDRLVKRPRTVGSVSETCLYFGADFSVRHPSFLLLNGEGTGPINNIAFVSSVSPSYAPPGKSLASVVVLGNPDEEDGRLGVRVREQLVDWFGREAAGWSHLATYRIVHALPDQSPPTGSPFDARPMLRPGLFVCGEHGSLPGIQWALFSGRRAAEAVVDFLSKKR